MDNLLGFFVGGLAAILLLVVEAAIRRGRKTDKED